MQFWTPDVYEGAPTPVTAYLAVTSKAAGFAIFLRFVAATGPGRAFTFESGGVSQSITLDWPLVIGAIAALTMSFGNLAALFQRNVKRLLAYSSIAHAGYVLMGIAALQARSSPGAPAVAFYMVVYLFMNLGAFAVVMALDKALRTEDIEGYRGLGARSPLVASLMTVFLVALIGLPPTAGFVGKMQLFGSAIETNLVWLAVIAGINTAISVYYYARIIKVMWLDASDDATPLGIPGRSVALIALMAVPVLVLGIFFSGLLDETRALVLLGLGGR
jgi:NADH-quinone oxidoreductase subunit N